MKQAMIFAAGLGTRLKPITDTMPKALVRVGGVPLLQHVVLKLKAAGFERIVVNVHHFAQQIIDFLSANDSFGLDIRISDERSELLETGGGIRKALPLLDRESPVLIHNVDILSNADVSEIYDAALNGQGKPDGVLLCSWRKTKRYLLADDENRLVGWTNVETGEVKAPDRQLDVNGCRKWAFSGIHVLAPTLFPLLEGWPERFPVMDFYLRHCGEVTLRCLPKENLQLTDVGKLNTLDEAERLFHALV